jgi:hypothetical protein
LDLEAWSPKIVTKESSNSLERDLSNPDFQINKLLQSPQENISSKSRKKESLYNINEAPKNPRNLEQRIHQRSRQNIQNQSNSCLNISNQAQNNSPEQQRVADDNSNN